MTAAAFLSVFLMALFGGVHCAAMCGGLVVAVEQPAPGQHLLRRVSSLRLLFEQFVMHLGRIFMYALLGALMGAIGATLWRQDVLPLQRWLFAAASALLLLFGLVLLGGSGRWPGTGWIEAGVMRILAALRTRIAARLGHIFPPALLWQRFVVGLGWGLVPCGMIYSALALSLLAGSALSGGLLMLVFGLGTLPNLMLMSGLAGWLRQVTRMRAARIASAAVMAGFGLFGMWRALMLPDSLNAHGFCVVG